MSVAANGGAPGVDGVTISDVIDGVGVPVFLDGLAARLQAKTYRPVALRRVLGYIRFVCGKPICGRELEIRCSERWVTFLSVGIGGGGGCC